MKIGAMNGPALSQSTNDAPGKMKASAGKFQSALGALMNGSIQEEGTTIVLEETDPIRQLLKEMMEDGEYCSLELPNGLIDLDVSELEQLIDQNFPELNELMDQLLTLLSVPTDAEKILSGSRVENGISVTSIEQADQNTLSKVVNVLMLLGELTKDTLQQLPGDKLAEFLRIARTLQSAHQFMQVAPTEMKMLEQMEVSMAKLLEQLRQMGNESRLQHAAESVNLASGKAKQPVLPLFPAIPKFSGGDLQSVSLTEPSEVVYINTSQQQLSRVEQFTLHMPDKPGHEPRMSEFMKEFSNILARSSLSQGANGTKLLIKLYPEQLGQLRVELLQKDGMMIARMMATTHLAKDMLDSQLHSLKQAFTQQNIQVEKIEVTFSHGETQKYTSQDGREEQPTEQKDKRGTTHQEVEESSSFQDQLDTLLFETEV